MEHPVVCRPCFISFAEKLVACLAVSCVVWKALSQGPKGGRAGRPDGSQSMSVF